MEVNAMSSNPLDGLPSIGAPVQTTPDAGLEFRIGGCCARVEAILGAWHRLYGETEASADHDETGSAAWAAWDAELSAALLDISLWMSASRSALLSKFRCFDLLRDTLGTDDQRTLRFQDAVLRDCRRYIERSQLSQAAYNEMPPPSRNGGSPFLRMFSVPISAFGRGGSRRSQG